MSVRIYDAESGGNEISRGDEANPIIIRADASGETVETKLWIRHDDSLDASYDVSCQARDDTPTDESSWITVAEDVAGVPGTYAANKELGDVTAGSNVPFWIKAIVPGSYTPYGGKTDIKIELTSDSARGSTTVLMDSQTITDPAMTLLNGVATYHTKEAGSASWSSEWISTAGWTDFYGVTSANEYRNLVGRSVKYRDAASSSGSSPSAWFSNPSSLDLSRGYIQIKFEWTLTSAQDGLNRFVFTTASFDLGTNWSEDITGSDLSPTPATVNNAGEQLTVTFTTDNRTMRSWGWFYAPVDGTYTFRITSAADQKCFLAVGDWEVADMDLGVEGEDGQFDVYLTQGLHKIRRDMSKGGGSTQTQTLYITVPGESERADLVADYYPPLGNAVAQMTSFTYEWEGQVVDDYDLLIYYGPAAPVLGFPADGATTEYFQPEFQAYSPHATKLEFQMDTALTYSTANFESWEVVTTDNETVYTTPPDSDRPSGLYYWRVRAFQDGVWGPWSPSRTLTILDISDEETNMYLLANVGLEDIDERAQRRFLHLLSNVSILFGDQRYNQESFYLVANVTEATGKITYPIQDKTAVRKVEFGSPADDFIEP